MPMGFASTSFSKISGRDYKTLNTETALALAETKNPGIITALDPNLKPFFARGGKLLQHHGWADQLIIPDYTIDDYNKVVDTIGSVKSVNDSYRLFTVPGMAHCRGGERANNFDTLTALEQWKKERKAPDRIIASRCVTA